MLTSKQKMMLTVLINHLQHYHVAPSFAEMCAILGVKSKSGIHRLLASLEEKGYICRLHNKARAIKLLKNLDGTPLTPETRESETPVSETPVSETASVTSIPLLGTIAAGTPIEAISHADATLAIPPTLLGSGQYYALEIEGDSMIDAGIRDGDTVLIEQCDTAPDGSIVVALIDREEATLKKLRSQGASIALEAANPAYQTRIFAADRITIQGRLTGLLRRY